VREGALLGATSAVAFVAATVGAFTLFAVVFMVVFYRRQAIGRALREARSASAERVRLKLAALLLDLGNHLMLSGEERRALRLQKKLSSPRARRLGIKAAAMRAGARRVDDITLEIPIGTRRQEGNPGRTLVLSCVIHEPPSRDGVRAAHEEEESARSVFWRVVNKASEGYRGASVTVEVPELESALIAYDARPLRPADSAGGRFFDEGVHDETAT
jgi:hypothetical protein